MNIKERYRAKLIQKMFQQEQEEQNIKNQQNYSKFDHSKDQKSKTIIQNVYQKSSNEYKSIPYIKKGKAQEDKQNQGDTYNNLTNRLNYDNMKQSEYYKRKESVQRRAFNNSPNVLLELSQIQHQNKLLLINEGKNKQKKAKFIDKVKKVNQQNSQNSKQILKQGIKVDILSQQEQKLNLMNEKNDQQLKIEKKQESLSDSSIKRLIKKDKTVVALFDDTSFNITIDIEISSGTKIPLQVNQKSNIKLVSQQFVKAHNLSSFGNLASLLQKQIHHQIQKQKKQRICSKYQKQTSEYEMITKNNHIFQVLIKDQQDEAKQNKTQYEKNYNSNSIQEIQEVQYMNLRLKQPFLIPNKFYQKAREQNYLKKLQQNAKKLKLHNHQQVKQRKQFQVNRSYNDQNQNTSNNIFFQLQVQQKNNKQNLCNQKNQKRVSNAQKKFNFTDQNCFNQIQQIKIKNGDKDKSQIQFNHVLNFQSCQEETVQNSQRNQVQQIISRKNQIQTKRVVQKDLNIKKQNILKKQKEEDSKYQKIELIQQSSQQQNQRQFTNDSILSEQVQNSCPKINIISQQIVNRLGKENILLEKKKKSYHIKESILLERQLKLKKQLQQCSFKPKINLISKFIDKKVKLSQFLQKRTSENIDSKQFQNQITTKNNSIILQKASFKCSGDRFNQLYQNSKTLSNKKEQIRRKSIEQLPFRPQINTISKKIIQSKRNSKDLTDSIAKVRNRGDSFQFKPKILFHGKDMNYALDRNLQGLPIGDYLYKQAMKLRKKRQSLQTITTENFKTLQTSQKIIQSTKQRKLQIIFNQLAKFSKDECLYPTDFNLESPKFRKDSKNLIKYFVPLLKEMQQLQIQLNKEQFIRSALKLFSTLSQKQKAQILNLKDQPSQKQIQKKQNKQSLKKVNDIANKNERDDIYFRGLMHRKNVKQKIELELENKVRKELVQCTFKPLIKNYMTIQ